jgi:ORF6N domain-containing protein
MMDLQVIQSKIHEIRGQQVMLDFDLAQLYEVETRALKQAVRRNIERFPPDFMFELADSEINNLVSQNVIPSKSYLGGALPYAFLEPGVAMLSSVLKSVRAIEVNISIIRAFIAIRKYMIQAAPSSLSGELEEIKERIKALEEIDEENEKKFDDIYIALTQLAMKQQLVVRSRNPIGFIKPKE